MRSESFYCALMLVLIGVSCVPQDVEFVQTDGYIPVYGTAEASAVKWLGARAVNNPGKIYVYGQYLLINETGQGIHVYDNGDISSPTPVGFIQILGNTDMAIKDNRLYADHMGDLLHISISSFSELKEEGRLPLQEWNLGLPPPANSYFECVDASRGIVIAWKKATLSTHDCYAIQ
jgi:hypothetical protein